MRLLFSHVYCAVYTFVNLFLFIFLSHEAVVDIHVQCTCTYNFKHVLFCKPCVCCVLFIVWGELGCVERVG